MPNNLPPTLHFDPCQSRSVNTQPPAHLQHMIDRRWKQWEAWVEIRLARLHGNQRAVVTAETARLRERHKEQILALTWAGVAMRLVRRAQLDDPLLSDDARAVLVRAMMERRRKARVSRHENLATRINIAGLGLNPRALDITLSDSQENAKPTEAFPQPPQRVTDPQQLHRTIETIRQRVSDYFQTAKLRDPDLEVRSHRQVFAFPRQLAMYIARRLTGAPLQEIGRHFGGMHYTTVLHSLKRVEEMRRSDKALKGAIQKLEASQLL